MENSGCLAAMALYTVISHVAITCHMTLVQRFGGVAAVLVGNFRKALTIYLSFLLFPKPRSIWYVVGGVCVFGGLLGQEYTRERRKQQARKWAKTSDLDLPAALRDAPEGHQEGELAPRHPHHSSSSTSGGR